MSNFFSFNWFSNPDRDKIKEQLEELAEKVDNITTQCEQIKPTKSIYFTGNFITIVLQDGSILSGEATIVQFEEIKNADSVEDIKKILYPPKPINYDNSIEEIKLVQDNLAILKIHSDFRVENSKVYLNGVNLEIPSIIVTTFIRILEQKLQISTMSYEGNTYDDNELDEEYESLKMFWYFTALNPIESSREDLYKFIKNNKIELTSNGQLILYRRANLVKKENKLIDFVSKEYFKIKGRWKKNPNNYSIYHENDVYKIIENNKIASPSFQDNNYIVDGNLANLYMDLPNLENNHLTDAHTGKMIIKVGGVYSIPEEEVDINSRASCSKGLHCCSKEYNYSGFGDTPLLVIVNPSKVRSVPIGEESKMRVSEMFIASILELDKDGNYIDFERLVDFDKEYFNMNVQELQDILKTKSFGKLTCQDTVPELKLTDIKDIINLLSKRVVII